jgi:signal transduction histidine kinase
MPAESRDPVVMRVRRGGGRVMFEVQDSGTGLPPGARDRVFRPFFSTKRQGIGLGLSVARQIVEGHGGELELAARAEGGVIARVALPEGGGGE